MNPNIARRRKQHAAEIRNGAHQNAPAQHNISETERWTSVFAGGVLTACGLLRGSTSGLALAALGGGLAYRGITGHCSMYQALGYNTADDAK